MNEARFIRHEQEKGDNMTIIRLTLSGQQKFDVSDDVAFFGNILVEYDNDSGIGRPLWVFNTEESVRIHSLDPIPSYIMDQIDSILETLNM